MIITLIVSNGLWLKQCELHNILVCNYYFKACLNRIFTDQKLNELYAFNVSSPNIDMNFDKNVKISILAL